MFEKNALRLFLSNCLIQFNVTEDEVFRTKSQLRAMNGGSGKSFKAHERCPMLVIEGESHGIKMGKMEIPMKPENLKLVGEYLIKQSDEWEAKAGEELPWNVMNII